MVRQSKTVRPVSSLPVQQSPELSAPPEVPAQPIAKDGLNGEKPKRGRRPADESNAVAIRTRLASWSREPEAQRPSLRALAVELGTSHQLLSFYLKGLNDWQKEEYRRQAKAIRDRADAEDRPMTPWEESQMRTLEYRAFCCSLGSELERMVKRWDAQAGPLSKPELKIITLLAQKGMPIAIKVLEKCRNNLPVAGSDKAKSFRSTSR